MQSTQHGKVLIWPVDGGDPIERWPVDARAMVKCGEFAYEAGGGGQDGAAPEAVDEDELLSRTLAGGHRIEKNGRWYSLLDSDGNKVGKAGSTYEEALAQLPVSPTGAPLNATTEAGPAQPVKLPGNGG